MRASRAISGWPSPHAPRHEGLRSELEVGTGCGYQTLILAALVPMVYSVERLGALQLRARQTLNGLKVRNVRFRHADGGWGWPQHAPYGGILVSAAPAEVPAALLAQLAVDGRLVIPVGSPSGQELLLITRRSETDYARKLLDRVSFVPLVGGLE